MKKNRKGLYETQVTLNGKRKVFSAKTQIELKRKIAAYTETVQKGMLFFDVAEQWMTKALPEYPFGTYKSYSPAAKRAQAHFGEYRLTEITPAMIHAYIRSLGKKYASKTCSNQLTVISVIFRWAILQGWISVNPADQVDVPAGLKKTKRTAATPAQTAIIKAHTDGFGLVANLILYTGLRIGEACALRYCDIDRDRKTVFVDKQIVWKGNRPTIDDTKTESGERNVVLLEPLLKILPKGDPNVYIVGNDVKPIARGRFRRSWASWCNSVGLAHIETTIENEKEKKTIVADITPHQLRHSYATMLWEAGIQPEIAQQLMGHADIHTTQQIYLDIQTRHLELAAAALNAHLEKPQCAD